MYYKDMFQKENEVVAERHALTILRLHEIQKEETVAMPYRDFFQKTADFLIMVEDTRALLAGGAFSDLPVDMLRDMNNCFYQELLPHFYDTSYANPAYAVMKLGMEYGQLLSFLYSELRSEIVDIYEGRLFDITILNELFIEIYNLFEEEVSPPQAQPIGETYEVSPSQAVKDAIYYFVSDYADRTVTYRTREQLDPSLDFAVNIIMQSDLMNAAYLYQYGEYIGENELKLAEHFANMEQEQIEAMARTYTEGFREGFVAAGIDLSKKKYVNIRYNIGQERMVRAAIEQFKEMGLTPVIYREAKLRVNRKGVNRIGYMSTSPNRQYEFDHRQDEALFLDKAFVERKLEVVRAAYEEYKEYTKAYAGPACIEVFGEMPFEPESKEASLKLSKKQQELSVAYSTEAGQISNQYIPRDQYSFTIIAYPLPEIGENFAEIFHEIVKVNTLSNDLYRGLQQIIIDELDKAVYVKVKGTGPNKTDMKVMLHTLADPSKETIFENCVADVNIPVGEVFTSPKLTGTEGILHVSGVYLNELYYKNLTLKFVDGKVTEYTCDNFADEKENKAFIKENLLFNHETLPIGEFAIGTNTTAYVMAQRYHIIHKLPILIVEKMGPHFAVGDTCYSYSEDNRLYNPDGKEIVAKDNECSILRHEDMGKAYFNCHTDITIPYEEIGTITAVHADGTEVDIIREGDFVLHGLEELNKPFYEG